MSRSRDPLADLQLELRAFAARRRWPRYHTPKNLAMALAVEAAELLEIFQWLTPAQSRRVNGAERVHLGEEIADVLIYLARLADVCGVDVWPAVRDKMGKNALKYPAGRAARPLDGPRRSSTPSRSARARR